MKCIVSAAAIALLFVCSGCDIIRATDGTIPFDIQRNAQTTREEAGAITVDGRTFLMDRVVHTWIEDGNTGPGVGQSRTNVFREVRVRGTVVRCSALNDDDCVRRIRQALREDDEEH